MSQNESERMKLDRTVARIRRQAEKHDRLEELASFDRIARTYMRDVGSRPCGPRRARRSSTPPIEEVRRGYVALGQAIRIVGTHEDHAVRHKAEKALRGIRHRRVDFTTASESLKKVQDANLERQLATAETAQSLDDRFSLKSIDTVENAMAVGKKLRNCVARADMAKQYLRYRGLQLWCVFHRGSPLWLLAVDPNRKTIVECKKRRNKPAKPADLGRDVTRKLLRVLDVSADDIPAFVVAGYHSALRGRDSLASEAFLIGGREYTAHPFANRVLIGRRKPGRRWKWSLFRWTRKSSLKAAFKSEQPVSKSKLIGLIVEYPEFGTRLRG